MSTSHDAEATATGMEDMKDLTVNQSGKATQCTRRQVATRQSQILNLKSPYSPHTTTAGDQ